MLHSFQIPHATCILNINSTSTFQMLIPQGHANVNSTSTFMPNVNPTSTCMPNVNHTSACMPNVNPISTCLYRHLSYMLKYHSH